MTRASHQILASLLAVGLSSSCVTATVWGGGVEDDADGSSSIVFTGGTPFSESIWVNALATPFALVLDLCLSPVQAYLYGWADDDDEDEDNFQWEGGQGSNNSSPPKPPAAPPTRKRVAPAVLAPK